jgi:hypothetical protein
MDNENKDAAPENPKTIQVQANEVIKPRLTAEVGLRTKGGLSHANFDVAVVFASKCIMAGDDYDEGASLEVQNQKSLQMRNYAIGTIFASTAWLEAEINEFFVNAVDCMPEDARKRGCKRGIMPDEVKPQGYLKSLSPEVVKSMAQMWLQKKKIELWDDFPCLSTYLEREKRSYSRPLRDYCGNIQDWPTTWPISDKYQLALFLNQKYGQRFYLDVEMKWPVLDKYQLALYLNSKANFYCQPLRWDHPLRERVRTLIKLRNYLIHPKPEWVTTKALKHEKLGPEKDETAELERSVKGLIELDPARPGVGYAYELEFSWLHFPFNCLWPSLAKIAVRSVFEFVGEFCKRMEIGSTTLQHPLLARPQSLIFR